MKYEDYDWVEIQNYYDLGNSGSKCCEKFGCGHTTWNKAVKRLDIKTRKRVKKAPILKTGHKLKYDWVEIQNYYDLGNPIRDCKSKFGCGSIAISKAIKAGRFKTRNLGTAMQLMHDSGRYTAVWSPESRDLMRKRAIENGLGGHRNSHTIDYNGIKLDSSYEYRMAVLLDRDNIEWCRPEKRFAWIDMSGGKHKYLPDFYLPKHDRYLDPKHKYLVSSHKDKIDRVIEQNDVKISIVPIEMIEKWEKQGFCIQDLEVIQN